MKARGSDSARYSRLGIAFSFTLLCLLPALPARAVVTGQCVQARGGNSCTANDVTFVLVGLGGQTDGCVGPTDTVTLNLGAKVSNTTAQTRYDIGMYIYDFLGTEPAGNPAASAGYAYNGSDCARETLKPVGTFSPAETCTTSPALDLVTGNGPFLNADDNADRCGDLNKSTTCGDSFMVFPEPITVKCSDGLGGAAADGFVDIPTCATWGNSADEVPGGKANCGATNATHPETDVLPGTGSKCNCANVNSNIPRPSLSLSCSCSPTVVRTGATNGASTACTVTFTNNVTCVPDGTTAERFRCGAASFMQFDTVAGTPNGSFIFGQTQGNAPTETTGGSVDISTAGTVRWTPRDTVATGGGTTLGVIGHNETGTLSFQYFVNPAVPNNTTINFVTTAYWSNVSSFSPRVSQSALTTTCSIRTDVNATWAAVTNVRAREEQGRVVLLWDTAAEIGTAAFELERQDPATGRFVRVTDRPLPAVAQLPGGHYRFVDPTAQRGPRGQALAYRITEVNQEGKRETFGPFRVQVAAAGSRGGEDQGGGVRAGDVRGGDFQAAGKPVSARLVRAASERPKVSSASASSAAPAMARRAKVSVASGGLQRVRLADLAGALGLGTNEAAGQLGAGRFRLSHGGQEVAWQAAGNGDGLVFYGEAVHNAFTDVSTYWLEPGRGQLVATATGPPVGSPAAGSFTDTLHLETDAIPAVAAPVPVDDFWIWKGFFPGFPGFDRATFPVAVPAPAGGGGTLAVHLYGFAATQRAELRLNGRNLGELAWGGTGPATVTAAVPAGALVDGGNQIEIVALEGELGFWLDSFDLTYPRTYRAQDDRLAFRAAAGATVALTGFHSSDVTVYDVAVPLAPRRLGGLSVQPQGAGSWGAAFVAPDAGPFVAATGAALYPAGVRASAPADLRNPSRAATYLVISPPELRAEAQRLADLRSAQGLTALVVDVGDVMDVFGDGRYDPAAIQSFLAYAAKSWSTPPRYVVLAGKGTYDYRNLLGLSSNLVPPLLVATDTGLVPADSLFTDFDGGGVPAVAIGRIPALTAAEMRAFVDKLAAYESDAGGAWTGQVLLAADDADGGGDFPAASQSLAGTLPAGLALSRVTADPAQIQASRSQLQAALRQGQVLMNYVGHGGLDRLGSEGLLLTTDVAQLGNAPRLPVLTALTCLISQFAYPTVTSLGEELVLRSDGGAIAVFGPTWLSYNTPATALGGYLLPQLAAPGGGRLGDRLLRGLNAYAAAGGDRKMLRLYTLLGDPAQVLKR
ncbi:MAG: hypothetical protein QOF89_5469 [Acidobacteriota bacterium]|jgi:hypothetical protein|nr:hypothetical protein [Acidobacteriota bacterium]